MIPKHPRKFWLAAGGVAALAALVWALGAPARVEAPNRRVSTPFYPTMPNGSPNVMYSYWATPRPDEKVEVVGVHELSSTAAATPTAPALPIRFTAVWKTAANGTDSIQTVYVRNPATGQVV